MIGAALLAALMLAGGDGCVEQDASQKKIDPSYIKRNILRAAPAAIKNRVDADLGGQVTYLGNDADRSSLAPGARVKVVHYWKVVSPPGSEWRVFTHLVGAGKNWLNLDQSDMRIGYPPGEWKAGDIVRDEQEFTLPSSWSSPTAQLVVGLYRKGSSSASDRMQVQSGPADSESRVLALRFTVDRAGAHAAAGRAPPPMQYMARRATGPITIDGAAGEKDCSRPHPAPPSPAPRAAPR